MTDPNVAPATLDPNQLLQQQTELTAEERAIVDQHNIKEIMVVDASHGVQSEAVDRTDAYIAAETSQRGIRGFLKKIWKGNLAHDYIRQREITKNRDSIVKSGNLYGDATGAEHGAAMQALTTRFTEGMMQSDETAQSMQETEAGQQLSTHVNELVKTFASTNMSSETLKEERTRILSEYGKGRHKEDRNKGILFADNIIEVALAVRAAVGHGLALERIDAVLGGKVAEAKLGAQTEVIRTLSDKAIDKLYASKLGSLVNETTLTTAVAVVATLAKFTTRKATTAVAATVGIGIGATLVAGAREHRRVAIDRATHMRGHAVGEEAATAGHGKRRDKIEETRYESVAATDLLDRLAQARSAVDESDPTTIDTLLQAYTELDTRSKLSDEQSIDLIQYSSKSSLEVERLQLMRALIESKVALRRAGVSDETLTERSAACLDLLRDDVTEKDRAFSKLQRTQTMKMAAVGLVSGLAVGEAIQEIKGAVSDELRGVFEGEHDDQQRRTLLAALFRSDHHNGAEHVSVPGHETRVNDNLSLGLPEGYHTQEVSPGHVSLVGPGEKVLVDNLGFDKEGHIDAAHLAELKQHGIGVTNSHTVEYSTHHTVTEMATRTPSEYQMAHPGEFTTVHRELWYDNNTPNHFDDNELRLDWGGDKGTGMNADGNYVLNVHNMMANGSFHGENAANAQKLLEEGKLALAMSFDRDSQSHVMMIQFDKAGNAIVDAKSFAGRSMFDMHEGQARFNGGFAEAVQLMGANPKGGETIRTLATVVGNNDPKAAADRVTHIVTSMHERTVADLRIAEGSRELPIEIPVPIPVYARGGLESRIEQEGLYGYGYGYGQYNKYWERWNQERSPRLRENPNADLDTGEELSWYRKQQSKDRGTSYLKEIDAYVAENENLLEIGDETKAIVCIPVAGASESENIYRTLSMFARQDEEARRASIIMLNVNWKQALEADPDAVEKIAKTKSEIARAQADFPDLRIASFDKVWSDDFVKDKDGKIYGEVIKVLYDTAAFALDQAVKEGRRQSATEALLITNDADTGGMAPHYLRNYTEGMNRYPTADVFSATILRGTDTYKDYPGYGFASDFYAILNMMSQRQQKAGNGGFTTEGPNSGIRMSMYAAIGGCEHRIGAGADAVLGQRIAAARREPSTPTLWSRLRSGKKVGITGDRVVGQYIGGAQIDTLPDRLLGAYRQGKWIARGWDKFDDGGYEDRSVSMAAGDLDHEDPEKDIDEIARRIEISVEGFASHWYRDPAIVSTALTVCFGKSTDDEKLYDFEWDWSKSGDGAFKFGFTEEGKKQLQDRMLKRDKFDLRAPNPKYNSRVSRHFDNLPQLLANPRMLS